MFADDDFIESVAIANDTDPDKSADEKSEDLKKDICDVKDDGTSDTCQKDENGDWIVSQKAFLDYMAEDSNRSD